MRRRSSLFLSVILCLFVAQVVVEVAKADHVPMRCNGRHDGFLYSTVDFDLKLDAHPSETGYSLRCLDSERVATTYFSAGRGSFTDDSHKFHRVHETTCVPTDSTCYLTIEDSPMMRDGLGSEQGTGWFALVVDGALLAGYDGSMENAAFEEYQVCFGDTCSSADDVDFRGDSSPISEESSCEDVMLTIFFDGSPEDVAYRLICDGQTLWNKPAGSYLEAFDIIEETEPCVNPVDKCLFAIWDARGDGLTAGDEYGEGFFALNYGARSIAVYDGSAGENAKEGTSGGRYSERTYSFGPACEDGFVCEETFYAADDSDVDETSSECSQVKFRIELDEFPAEVGHSFRCGSDTIWDVPRGFYLPREEFQTFTKEVCIPTTVSCCTLTVIDSPKWKDGLSSPQAKMPGGFTLSWNGATVVWYDGSDKDADYEVITFEVGSSNCGSLVR